MARAPFRRGKAGPVEVRLDARDVSVLEALLAELRVLIDDPTAAGDEVAGRLCPEVHVDDPLAEEEFRGLVGPQLADERRQAANVVARTLSEERHGRAVTATLTADEVEAWMISLNHLRLALGTALGVEEDTFYPPGMKSGDPGEEQLAIYTWLTFLFDALVEASTALVE